MGWANRTELSHRINKKPEAHVFPFCYDSDRGLVKEEYLMIIMG